MDVDRIRWAASEIARTLQYTSEYDRRYREDTLRQQLTNFLQATGASVPYGMDLNSQVLLAVTHSIANLDKILAAFAAKRMENPHGE